MADQKVTLKPPPPEPVVSRPLKTGASFTLILPKKRFVYRHWDKEKYLPEEEGELILEGEGIGNEKYEFIIERADSEDGPWTEVKTVKADVQGDKATARYKFPKPEAHGHLTRVEWKRTRAKPGDRLGMHVEAEGYEGGFLSIHVEKKNDQGEWDVYARWSGEIEQGKFDTVFPIPRGKESPEEWKDGKVVELSFDGEPHENDTAWMVAKTEKFDGSALQFVLERTDDNGNWQEVGSAVSTVKDGQARNSVSVGPAIHVGPASKPGPGGAVPVRFGKPVFHKGEELVVWVDPRWLKGNGFEVTMERRLMLDGESWEEVAIVDAEPTQAKGPGGGYWDGKDGDRPPNEGPGSSGGGPGSGTSGSGTSGSGTSGSGTSGSGTSGSGTSGSGTSGSGTSGSGTSGSGTSGSGTSGSGTSGSGTSGSGTSGSGTSGSGTSGSGTSGSGTSGSGTSGSGTSGSGTSGTGTSGSGASGTGTSGSGTSGTGTSGSGTSGTGTSGSGTSGSGASGSGTSGTGTSGSGTSGTGTSGSGTSGTGTSGSGTSGTGTSGSGAGTGGTTAGGPGSGGAVGTSGGAGAGAAGSAGGSGAGGASGGAGGIGTGGSAAAGAAHGGKGGPSGVEIAGVAAGGAAVAGMVAGGVKLASKAKDKAGEAGSNKDDSANVEE